jgi:hypothetical protein
VGAEEAYRADGDVDAGRGLLLLLAQEQEVVADVLLGERIGLGRSPVEEQARGQAISGLGLGAVVAQAHVGGHPSAPVFRSDHRVLRGCPTTPRRGGGGLRLAGLRKRDAIGYAANVRRDDEAGLARPGTDGCVSPPSATALGAVSFNFTLDLTRPSLRSGPRRSTWRRYAVQN